MDSQRFRGLSDHNRALVAIAVLLDGNEAGMYFEMDAVNSAGLKRAALELAALSPELRMPLAGTMIREALEKEPR